MTELTQENLKADREVYAKQVAALQAVVSYIDGLLAFMNKEPEGVPAPPPGPVADCCANGPCETTEPLGE